jgi:hypothetical protein
VLSGLSNSAGNPVIQLGSGSYTTSGYAGYCTYQTAGTNALANVSSAAGFPVNAGAALVTGSVILTLINSSTNTWAASGQHYSALGTVYLNTVYGYIALAGVLDRIQIATTTGTFSTGTVNIIYEG